MELDRLYVGLDGSKRHRIRNLADGTQQMLAVDEDRVIATYGRNPAKGASVHYKRQSDEKILLVPGAPEQVAVVREIYRRRLVEGEGTMRVARSLNDRGVPSPSGKLWQVETVESVLTNPTYTGAGITARYASGLYHVHGEQAAPKALVRDLRQIATKKSKTSKLRPREQWHWQPHPLMVDYLGDANLRELATAFQEKCFERQHRKATAPPNTKEMNQKRTPRIKSRRSSAEGAVRGLRRHTSYHSSYRFPTFAVTSPCRSGRHVLGTGFH
jgi:hypothetical protein